MPVKYDIDMDSDISAFINRLEKFDKEVSKKLKKGMKRGVGYVVKEAQSRIDSIPDPPLSRWAYSWVEQDRTENVRNLTYSASRAKAKVKPAVFRARRRGVTVAFGYQAVQKDPAASIFELAGTKNPGANAFNRNINRRYGTRRIPRVMYPAYYSGQRKARKEIEKELQEARKAVGL